MARSGIRAPFNRLVRKVSYFWGPRAMSWLRRKWIVVRHPYARIEFRGPVYVGPGFSLHIPGHATFIAGPGVEFRRNFRAELGEGGRIEIGAGSVFTYSVLIQCSTSVDIGERCIFGQASAIFDGQHRFRDLSRPLLEQGYDFRPIRIEDDAMITTKCTVMADVGKRAFVGANSVVTRPIPPYTVAVGAPARPVDYFGPEGQEPPELALDSAAGRGEGAG